MAGTDVNLLISDLSFSFVLGISSTLEKTCVFHKSNEYLPTPQIFRPATGVPLSPTLVARCGVRTVWGISTTFSVDNPFYSCNTVKSSPWASARVCRHVLPRVVSGPLVSPHNPSLRYGQTPRAPLYCHGHRVTGTTTRLPPPLNTVRPPGITLPSSLCKTTHGKENLKTRCDYLDSFVI